MNDFKTFLTWLSIILVGVGFLMLFSKPILAFKCLIIGITIISLNIINEY